MVLRRRTESLNGNDARPPSSFIPTTSQYAHVSSHRSLLMEVRINSPSVKVVGTEKKQLVPVFGDGDQVGGTVTLDSTSAASGRLLFTIEGAFFFNSSDVEAEGSHIKPERRKHVFYSSTSTTPVSPSLDSFLSFSNTRSSFRDAFTSTVRPRLKRRPSGSSLNAPASPPGFNRTYPFSFDLPRGYRSGEELPPTFTSNSRAPGSSCSSRKIGVSSPGSFGVEYKVSVTWEPADASDYPSFLDIPILYHPDADFQSQDISPAPDSSSWLEMPLRSDRPMPFRCAITLPTTVTFSRTSSIPYYVVFTTTPRSPALAREIATDATISVTLLRKVTVTEQSMLPPTPPETPSTGSEESEGGSRGILRLKRVVPSAWSPRNSDETLDREKPLPRLPMHTVFDESCMLHTSICIGFPKRPRQHTAGPEKHPSLGDQTALPDGLHKSKFTLSKDMLPSIDWSGVSVKYYVDISVLVGQDDVRARIPIRIV